MIVTNIKQYSFISWIIACIAINNIIVFTPNFGILYYVIMAVSLSYCLLRSRVYNLDVAMLCLYFCCVISILGNDIPSFLKPWERFITFLIMTMLLSPFFKSDFLFNVRIQVFFLIQKISELIILFSIIAYFLGFAYKVGFFAGITTHSMLIAPIAANVIIRSLYKVIDNGELSVKIRRYYYILFFCSFICLLMAASRTAILGTIGSIIFFFYWVNKHKSFRFFKYILILISIMAISYPIWSSSLEIVLDKNKSSISAGGIASSRDSHWKNRVKEFKSSPIIGIGFSSISTAPSSKGGSTFDISTGRIETGSSWLSSLSMLGILGFLYLFFIFFIGLKNAIFLSRVSLKLSAYLISLLLFWIIHMMAEGYIWGSGSFLFFNVWLLLGCIDAIVVKVNRNEYNIQNESL